MTPELFTSYWPAWIALSVSGLIAFNRLIEESQKFAAFFGKWGERRHGKAVKRHQIDLHASQFATAIQEAVADARTAWESEENEAIVALDARLATVAKVTAEQRRELAQVRLELQARDEYAEYEVAWHSEMRALAAMDEHIPAIAVPPHMNWWVFERKFVELGPNGAKTWWFAEDRDTTRTRRTPAADTRLGEPDDV